MAHIGSFFEIEEPSGKKQITDPPRARQKSVSIRSPSNQAEDHLVFGETNEGRRHTRTDSQTSNFTGATTPRTPSDLEHSRPSSPFDVATIAQTFWNPPMNKWRVLCCCLVYFGDGLSDSAPGALIPYMESPKEYGVGYAIISLIFISNAAGFIAAAFVTNIIHERYGRARSLVLAEIFMMAGYIMLVVTPPFWVVVCSFFLLGFGYAIGLALNNVFVANLANSTIILGLCHGSYSMGGTIGPILATAMASHGIRWSRFYFIALGVRVICAVFNAWAFWNYEKENTSSIQLLTAPERSAAAEYHDNTANPPNDEPSSGAAEQAPVAEPQQPLVRPESKRSLFKLALRNRTTLTGALFVFLHQGAEVSISGWIISFLIHYRGGDPSQVGYVTAGFFGGITIGRLFLVHLTHHVGGELVFVTALSIGAIAFQILTWQVPSLLSNYISIGVLGLLIGPIYPCSQTIMVRLLPPKIQMNAVGLIEGAGSSGGALAPFLTGLLAQARGTWVVNPVCVAMFAGMLACWWGLPRVKKPVE
ncbi:major facilitator superfamily domain-containing protein [Phyllosticta capitalensis]|uniref:Major facilitator superfamily domain-containing protein n=1 Tax=Phyllosticta capitalensis TaxID=121624 RepID=A0ABR1YQR5_9PEZI